jgi:hypothetical protein
VFQQVLLGYNALVYPFCLWLAFRILVPVIRARRRIAGPDPIDSEEVARQRRRALAVPGVVIVLSCLGWLPGGVLFPLVIHLAEGLPDLNVFGHFIVSFTISGLIAMTYSYFGVQVFVLRVLYTRMWIDPQHPAEQARKELGPIEGRLRVFQFAAGLIPLSGAILLIGVSGEELSNLVFRILVVGLIGLGMAGFGVALLASSRATQVLNVILGRGAK